MTNIHHLSEPRDLRIVEPIPGHFRLEADGVTVCELAASRSGTRINVSLNAPVCIARGTFDLDTEQFHTEGNADRWGTDL